MAMKGSIFSFTLILICLVGHVLSLYNYKKDKELKSYSFEDETENLEKAGTATKGMPNLHK